ncbi:hypothetical protein BDV96DRAFT_644725 [Lophiotrema nucula]|uniref:VWFA domain-containing protein n=1 Tax=Lophiotrema nucula TaxID=690887 RepID=A0A6A5ZCW4_9PLEO|nr:hypothetical protein BDV96DRAFT_644725 [Lophiotrema nucula]
MDLGLDGRTMMAVEPELLSEENDTNLEELENVSPIHMLELELETLAIELDDEKEKSVAQSANCDKHLQELHNAELSLLECREALQKSEKRVQEASFELDSKQKTSASLQKQLLQSKQLVGEAERQRNGAKEQLESKDALTESTVNDLVCKLDERTAELVDCRERCELLENEFSDHKALVIHQIGALEEEHEQQMSRLMDQIKTLERHRGSGAGSGQQQTQEASETKQANDSRRHVRGMKQQGTHQRSEVKKLEEQLDFRESRIALLNHEVEALQHKVRRIPALAGKISRLESIIRTSEVSEESENQRISNIVTDLQAQNKILASDVERAKQSNATIEKDRKKSTKRTAELEAEKARLERRIVELEQVRAQRSLIGIVLCVDISGSLAGTPEQLAKDAFRKFIEKIRAKYSNASVGVIVHASSVTTVRKISPLDATADRVIDSTWCGGSENYYSALSLVQTELASFNLSFPKAKRIVILISDGEDIGTPGNVATLAAWGIPCHNVVIQKSTAFASHETTKYATATGGTTIYFNGTDSREFDALIA